MPHHKTQEKDSFNSFRMVFSSVDKLTGSTLSNPKFDVDLSTGYLSAFDPLKPLFCSVESFFNSRSQVTNTITRVTASTAATVAGNPAVTTQNSTVTDTNVLSYPDIFSLSWVNAPFQLNVWVSETAISKNKNVIYTFKGDGARNDNFASKIASFKLYPSDITNLRNFEFKILDELFNESVQTFSSYVFTLIFWQE